jgi:dienelactone hydrolase
MNTPAPKSLQELQRQKGFNGEAPRADGRTTAFSAYIPESGDRAPPLAVLSHGAGGGCNEFRYLAEALRKAGWLAIVPGHAESSLEPLRQRIAEEGFRAGTLSLTLDPRAHRARQLDIEAVLAWVDTLYQPAFRALIGHSMGSATTLIDAGAANSVGLAGQNRFDAYVAMSPQGPGSLFPSDAWSGIRKPVLIMTGTRDQGLEGDWQWRAQVFHGLPAGRNWLAVIDGAGHFAFSGRGLRFGVRRLAVKTILAFLEPLCAGRSPSVVSDLGLSITAK